MIIIKKLIIITCYLVVKLVVWEEKSWKLDMIIALSKQQKDILRLANRRNKKTISYQLSLLTTCILY